MKREFHVQVFRVVRVINLKVKSRTMREALLSSKARVYSDAKLKWKKPNHKFVGFCLSSATGKTSAYQFKEVASV